MTLKEHIEDISNQLKRGAFANEKEKTVSHRIVNRLLQALKWPIFSPQIVIDEYSVEGRRVDFALCNPESTPRVFIEAKRIGNIDKGIKQLFEYAFHRGVPIVVLTDGQKWRFYHPAGEGSYEDRMVAEIDLIAQDSEECSNCLDRYLNYDDVKTGKAAKIITEDYRIIVSQRKIEERLPEIWGELVQEKDKNLLHVVIEKAQEKVGHEPTAEQVLTFLKSLGSETVSERQVVIPDIKSKPSSSRSKSKVQRLRVTIMPDGKIINHYHAKDTFIEVLELLGLEEVMEVNPQIVRTESFGSQRKDYKLICIQRGKYFINNDNNAFRKKDILERLAGKLGVQLNVELLEKH